MRNVSTFFSLLTLVLVLVLATACSSTGNGTDVAATSPAPNANANAPPGATAPAATTAGPPAASLPDCAGAPARCDAWNVRAHCVVGASGPEWVTETCSGGCYAGACSSTSCADECVLGDHCSLWDMKAGAFVPAGAATSLHDRARDYDRILRASMLPEGQVMNARYTDASRTAIAQYWGFHDSAIWTGSALAAEALRLLATRDPDAEAQVRALAATLHRDFAITGDPGYLARLVIPSGAGAPTLDEPNHCTDPEFHCSVSWGGAPHDWLGATSRDQYTGVVLGYALAYEATTDESVKKTIRDDLVTLATELMKSRSVPATIYVNDVPLQKDLALENVVLAPSEMEGGRVRVDLSTSDASDSHIDGMREFFPDYSVVVKQVLGIGIAIPRPTTALILGAIFRAALAATDGVAASKADHDAIQAYYASHAPAWLDVAAGWSFTSSCGSGYFANHLAVVAAYLWAHLETDPTLLPRVRDDVFDAKLWAALGGHKNAYFAYLWAGTRSAPNHDAVAAANEELAGFAPGPRVHAARSNASVARYEPHDATCTSPILCDTATLAVDVADRVVEDFLWQRQPWQLEDGGDAREVFPGVDYLAAYWAARRHGLLEDDRPGTCARKAP